MTSLVLTLASLTVGAPPAPPPPPAPANLPSPVLFIRVLGPQGMRVTFHPGTPGAKTYAAPADVAVRPGYVYRVELSGIPGVQGSLYPSFEVRGLLRVNLAQAARHPVPIVFPEEELRRVSQAGTMVTKAYFLEDPSQAPPLQTAPNDPIVFAVPPDADVLQEARARGRPMVVVRLGERVPPADELARTAIPNTILFPGDARLALPPAPPFIRWENWPVFDPVLGAKRSNEECLPDGGDVGPRVGVLPGGEIGNLNASDTVIRYRTEAGADRVVPSNRVCILVPRFAAARQEVIPAGVDSTLATTVSRTAKGNVEMVNHIPPGQTDAVKMLAATTGRKGPSGIQGRLLLHGFDNLKGVAITAMAQGTKVVGQVKEPDEITAYPYCEPVALFKWADPKEAQVGDVVTFYLRYYNHTRHPVENIVVSDSLTARLEYVVGSARSDREAQLTVQPNEVGSAILRWEVGGKLPPNESGILTFQSRVR